MISLVAGRPDWFFVDDETLKPVMWLPGGQVKQSTPRGSKPIIHRSMLPLLGTDEAENTRALLCEGAQAWKARDAWADARGFKFRTTQQQALDFIEPRRGVLVGDEMRLGKTLSAMAAHDPARGQLVIVAPLSTRAVWLGWAKRCFPDLEVGVCIGRKFDEETFNKPIVFCHYDIIAKWMSGRKIGTLILDETHFLTNPKTDRINAAVLMQNRSEKVIALTGTPIWNMPPNLWAVLGLVAPGAWGSYHEFCRRYGLPVETGYGTRYTGASNETELRERLSEIMIRRLWKDCADDLPAISRSVIVAEVSDAERRKLDITAGALKAERSNTAANLAAYRQQVSLIKVAVAHKEALKIIDRGQPVVLWTWHKNVAEQLKEKLGDKALLIHGEVTATTREDRIQAWKDSPTPKALIATMAVAQVGIDLSHAPIEIFVEIDYTPAILGQAEMRIFKPDRPMDVLFIVANHLVDQRLVRALISKLGASNAFGVGAACDAIDALRDAVMGPRDDGDLDRLLEDLLASAS